MCRSQAARVATIPRFLSRSPMCWSRRNPSRQPRFGLAKMDPRDRRAALLQSVSFNGIDFVEVVTDDQTELRVHFLNDVPLQGTLSATPTIDGGETIRSVAVNPVNDATDWDFDGNHVVLDLKVAAPGDFS